MLSCIENNVYERYKFETQISSPQCVPILGRGFEVGGYKCECKQGFEYPFEDLITYYDGQLVEAEFNNIVNDNATRYLMRFSFFLVIK